MLNIVFTLLLIPFAPAWIYGDLLNSEEFLSQQLCGSETGICRDISVVEGATDSKVGADAEKSEASFKDPGLFPVDSASASGFVPVKKADAYDIKIWARSVAAIDADSGTILYYEDGRRRTQIASLTKIMTAVLTIEEVKDLNEEVTITPEAVRQPGTVVGCPRSGYCLGNRLYSGEKVRAIDLLKAALMNSANDAATALGIHIAGSSEKFVEMMNDKARKLGLKDTNFCTPSGLEIDGQENECYSSAYDIARIAAYSLRHEKIWDVMRIPEDRFYSVGGNYMHELKSTDLIMDSTPNYLGVKTGFTPMAGMSLLAGAIDDTKTHRIIAVILDDNQRWEDMRTLTDWIFENFNWQ